MSPVAQAGAIAVRKRHGRVEFLVVGSRNNPGQWIFPKGHVERGETDAEAAARELEEEAGVTGDVLAPVGTSLYTSDYGDVRVKYFLVRAVGRTLPEERRPARWLPFDQARALLTSNDAKQLLEKARDKLHRSMGDD
jgi:8-oxo-dGTP pyrophosphatase MutT (NUDIX family)